MLRNQTQKQSSFYVCASCRRRHHQYLAQLHSSSRLRSYRLSTTLRPFSASVTTPANRPTSLRLQHGTTASRHGAPFTSRTDIRGVGGWSKFTFGSQSVPGQSNSAWEPASKNVPMPGTPSSTSALPGGGPTKIPAATGTSAWGRPTPANTAPAWGGRSSMLPGPGAPAWRGPGSGLKDSATAAWVPSARPPLGPTPAKPPPDSNIPPGPPTSPSGFARGALPRPVSTSAGSPHQPAVRQTPKLQSDENNGTGTSTPSTSAGALSSAPTRNTVGSGTPVGQHSPGSPNSSEQTIQPQQPSSLPTQPLHTSTTTSNLSTGAIRSARLNPTTYPGPSGLESAKAMGAAPPSNMPSKPALANGTLGAIPSSGLSGGNPFDAPFPGPGYPSFTGPHSAIAGRAAPGISSGAMAGKPTFGGAKSTFAGPSGWAPKKPVFGGAKSWTPSKTTPSAFGTPAKDGLSSNAESSSWRQRGEMSSSPTPTSFPPPKANAASGAPSKIHSSGRGQATDPHLERWIADRISIKPPVREPPSGAEFPQLLRRGSRRDAFESMSPFKLPSKRQEMSKVEPKAPNSQRAISAEQQGRNNQLPRSDRYPTWTTTSKPQAAESSWSTSPEPQGARDFEKAFSNAANASQNGASSKADKGLSSQAAPTDDWDHAPPVYSFRRNAAATRDASNAQPDNRPGGGNAHTEKNIDFRSRDRDYRGRGKDLGQNEDTYARRDKANRRKKFGGDRKLRTFEDEGVEEEDDYGEARAKRQSKYRKLEEKRAAEEAAAAAAQKTIRLPEYITVYDLAQALRIKPAAFLRDLEQLGFEDTLVDSVMTGETAALVSAEYGFEPTVESGMNVDLRPRPPPDDLSTVPPRPPIVTIMGHVDHGKTTILDTLRKSSIVAQEFGGITQHIGAFSVKLSMGKTITFLDTPGHAAFLSMRQRGANVTDIVVLVVAVDDSVKPQTIEAIRHAQNAKVPMIVAINKVDLDDSPNRLDLVKQDLAGHGVDVEDFGGDVQAVPISGKTGQGMRELEDAILTLSEVLDMRAETDGMAEGWVLEASIKTDGRAATVLVKRGTLRVGDLIVSGNAYTRVRILRNEAGVDIEEAGPGTPIEVYGSWKGEPMAGDMVLQAPDETKAQAAVDYRQEIAERAIAASQNADRERQEREQAEREAALKKKLEEADEDDAEAKADEPLDLGPKVVSFIVKGDVMGSVEAVSMAIQEVGNNEVRSRILRSSPGQITESDVDHMATAKGAIVNFNNPIPSHILSRAHASGVVILDHNIIYEAVQAVKDLLSAQLTPIYTQRILAEAMVQQVFPINITKRKYKNIAGAKVINGKVTRGGLYRVMRDGEEIHKGKLSALKQKQTDVKEVGNGVECGLMFEDFDAFEEGDQIQLYEDVEQKRYL